MATQETMLDDVLTSETTYDAEAVEQLIAANYPYASGELQVRRLWSKGLTHFCRVNWWRRSQFSAHRITTSAFVAIEETPAGLQFRELTVKHAA